MNTLNATIRSALTRGRCRECKLIVGDRWVTPSGVEVGLKHITQSEKPKFHLLTESTAAFSVTAWVERLFREREGTLIRE